MRSGLKCSCSLFLGEHKSRWEFSASCKICNFLRWIVFFLISNYDCVANIDYGTWFAGYEVDQIIEVVCQEKKQSSRCGKLGLVSRTSIMFELLLLYRFGLLARNLMVKRFWVLQGKSGWRVKPFLLLMCTALLIFWYKTTNIQFEETEVILEPKFYHFDLFGCVGLISKLLLLLVPFS